MNTIYEAWIDPGTGTESDTPHWSENVRGGMCSNDICGLSEPYADCGDSKLPPYITSGPTLVIESITPGDSDPDSFTWGDPFGQFVITPYGPVLRMETDICQGTTPAYGEWRTETVYATREVLNAIGTYNIKELPY